MQQLNKLIIEHKALQNENEALKAENAKVKQHIYRNLTRTQSDE